MIIDNREGAEIIYWIIDIAPYYGETEVGQVSESSFDFVEYLSKEDWASDLEALGIEIED